jgi:Alginate lyase
MITRTFAPLLLLATVFAPIAKAEHPFSLLSPAVVASLSTQRNTPLGQRFIHEADAHLNDTPHARARIHTEGTLPHQGIRDESIEAAKDFDIMAALGFAYRLTNDKQYLNAEDRFLSAWSKIYQPSLNPIDETRFEPVFLAFDLTRSDLPAATQQQVIVLFRTMATGYLDWEDKNPTKDIDNWNSHRIKHATLGAYLTGDPTLIARAAAAFRHQVKQNIRPDGSVDDFYERDALHYVTYDLEPLTIASLAAKAHGEDWFHTAKTGSPSVQMAVDWLIPYALGEKTHQEFAHSTVAFDAARDKAGEHGYSGPWEPAGSVNLFTLATCQDLHYAPTLAKICATTSRQPTPWVQLILNAEAK